MPYLVQLTADGQLINQWTLGPRPLTLGRTETVNDTEMSREHFTIYPDCGSYVVKDLNSKNGTFVNNHRLTAPHILKPNDQIRAGQTLFRYALDKKLKGLNTVIHELDSEVQKTGKGFSTMRREIYKKAGG